MDIMGVAAIGTSLQSRRMSEALAAAVLKEGLNMQRREGEMAVQLIESAASAPLASDGRTGNLLQTTA